MTQQNPLLKALSILAYPLVRFCIKHSLKLQDLEEAYKRAFLAVAQEEILKQGQRVTDSRLSVITGIHRREISRLKDPTTNDQSGKGLIVKIVGMWQAHSSFITKDKRPRILSYGFEGSEFSKLVKLVSNDLNPATILFELERVAAVERTAQGIRLGVKSFIPKDDYLEGFKTAASDTLDLLTAAEVNIFELNDIPHLHLRTEYDRVREDSLFEIKSWLLKEGHALHTRARDFLSKFDQDINPKKNFKGKLLKVSLGSFGLTIANPRKGKNDENT